MSMWSIADSKFLHSTKPTWASSLNDSDVPIYDLTQLSEDKNIRPDLTLVPLASAPPLWYNGKDIKTQEISSSFFF